MKMIDITFGPPLPISLGICGPSSTKDALSEQRGAAERQFSELVLKRMRETGESYCDAEFNVIRTPEGMDLWERARKEMMG